MIPSAAIRATLQTANFAIAAIVFLSSSAMATSVAVRISDQTGAPVDNAAIIFDPLDAAPASVHETAAIDQIDRQFVPRLTLVRTGTAISFPNSDRIRHQVYSFSTAKTFSLKLYAGAPQTSVVFDTPGLVVLGCNIHDSMTGFVGVVDTPYVRTTSAAGTASLDLPPGRYQLRVWQENLAQAYSAKLVVGSIVQSIPLQLKLAERGAAPPAWP